MERSGILLIDKPPGFTSFDVIGKLRGVLRQRSIGHGGTLDPNATGVLPLFLGRAAKAVDLAPNHNKSYRVGFRLGMTTDTQDIWGQVLTEGGCLPDENTLLQVLSAFRGEIDQLPPMYSAVQINGRRLYDLARKGVEVKRKTRRVTFHRIELCTYNPFTGEGILDVECSRGTYVRTLCHDVGERLSCGGVITSLRRTVAMGFPLEQCHTLERIQQAADEHEIDNLLLPVDSLFSSYRTVVLNDIQTGMFQNGRQLDLGRLKLPDRAEENPLRIYSREGLFLGLARADREANGLIIIKLFAIRNG